MRQAGINGYQFLDKIVQTPLCLPQPNTDAKAKLVEGTLRCAASAERARDVIAGDVGSATSSDPAPSSTLAGGEIGRGGVGGGAETTGGLTPAVQVSDNAGSVQEDAATTSTPTAVATALSTAPGAMNTKAKEKAAGEDGFTSEEKFQFTVDAAFLDPNPRRIKRIMNVYNFCRCVYDDMAASDEKEASKTIQKVAELLRVGDDPDRTRLRFRAVLLRWVILTEQWPFRMAMMVQVMLDDAQLHGGVEALYDGKAYAGVEQKEKFMLSSEWMSSKPGPSNPGYKEQPLHKFFRGAVQHYIYDFGRATHTGHQLGEHKDGGEATHSEIMELMSLDSDPEVFDALLYMNMPTPPSVEQQHEELLGCITLAECYAMTKHFSFNLNPAITSAIQRIVGGRSEYDATKKIYRSKTLEECVESRPEKPKNYTETAV